MPDVITQVIISDTREIRAKLPLQPGGETLEHRFRTNFAPGREIALGNREVTVFVQFEGEGAIDFPVLVTLTRPDGTIAAGPMEMKNRPNVALSSRPNVSGPSRPIAGGGIPGVASAPNTGTGPTTINTGEIGGGPADPPPPPLDIDRMTYTIAETDPNGQWSVTMTNTGSQDGVFRILIVHPGAQKPLSLFVTLGSRFSSGASHVILITNSRPVLTQQRDLAGQLTHEMAGRVSLEFDLVADVETSTSISTAALAELFAGIDVDNIGDFIRHKFNAVVLSEDGRKKLPVVAEHFTDALMFLATGSRKQLFFDISSDRRLTCVRGSA